MRRTIFPLALVLTALAVPSRSAPTDGSSWADYNVPAGRGTISGDDASEPGTYSLPSRTL